ncbi:MAG: RAMP superfamily CRISPR-associated protein [Planktothrix sp.]
MTNQFEITEPKPYEFVTFPTGSPLKKRPIGHDKYHEDRISGTLFITLTVQTPVHISSGVVAMGSDVGQNHIPLIKLMATDAQQNPIIPGSSLKGVVRAVYESITNSTLGVVTSKRKLKDTIPKDRLPCTNKEKLCPASRVFGAMNWQGVVEFSDSRLVSAQQDVGFIPSLYEPSSTSPTYFDDNGFVKGRKFYYHTDRAASPGQQNGIPVQQVGKLTFTTRVQLTNLTDAELGVLFIVLGQERTPQDRIALKVGGGKPIGMGTMTVEVTELKKPEKLRDRYLSYTTETESITGKELRQFIDSKIQQAHQQLIKKDQLDQLKRILKYPTNRQPPEGMY